MNPIKPKLKTEIIPILLLAIATLSSFYFYSQFPETVPTHWNFQGEVDGWSPRWLAAFMIPAMIFGIYLMLLLVPYLDPKKDRYEQFRLIYHKLKTAIIFFLLLIYFVTGINGLGYDIPVGSLVPSMVGLLFIVIGNYLSKIKPNWFLGIRTPWTLSSEEVWNKTHRLGAKLFVLAGLVLMFINFLPEKAALPLFIVVVAAVSVGPFAYSFYLFNQEQKKKDGNN